jgi:hypothetical protein
VWIILLHGIKKEKKEKKGNFLAFWKLEWTHHQKIKKHFSFQ